MALRNAIAPLTNMDNEFQSRWNNFFALKSKYQATKYENSFPLVFYTLSCENLT